MDSEYVEFRTLEEQIESYNENYNRISNSSPNDSNKKDSLKDSLKKAIEKYFIFTISIIIVTISSADILMSWNPKFLWVSPEYTEITHSCGSDETRYIWIKWFNIWNGISELYNVFYFIFVVPLIATSCLMIYDIYYCSKRIIFSSILLLCIVGGLIPSFDLYKHCDEDISIYYVLTFFGLSFYGFFAILDILDKTSPKWKLFFNFYITVMSFGSSYFIYSVLSVIGPKVEDAHFSHDYYDGDSNFIIAIRSYWGVFIIISGSLLFLVSCICGIPSNNFKNKKLDMVFSLLNVALVFVVSILQIYYGSRCIHKEENIEQNYKWISGTYPCAYKYNNDETEK
jgi:hypothetical protein